MRDLDAALRRKHSPPARPPERRRPQCSGTEYDERGQRALVPGIDRTSANRSSELLHLLRPVHAHVHHLMGLPDVLMDLLAEHGVPYDWTVHDYYTICPRVNLIGAGGKYCGEPDAASCNRCLAALGDDQGRPVSDTITSWRERFGAPSAAGAAGLRPQRGCSPPAGALFSGPARAGPAPPRSRCPTLESLAAPPGPGETVRVAVIGTIVPVKGAERLQACAAMTLAAAGCRWSFT